MLSRALMNPIAATLVVGRRREMTLPHQHHHRWLENAWPACPSHSVVGQVPCSLERWEWGCAGPLTLCVQPSSTPPHCLPRPRVSSNQREKPLMANAGDLCTCGQRPHLHHERHHHPQRIAPAPQPPRSRHHHAMIRGPEAGRRAEGMTWRVWEVAAVTGESLSLHCCHDETSRAGCIAPRRHEEG